MKTPYQNIDKAIEDFFLYEDFKEVEAFLSEELDYKVDLQKHDKFLKQLNFKLKSEINKRKDISLLDVISKNLKEGIEKNIEKPISVLKDLIGKGELSYQFRNLDKLTEEDIKELIKDKNLIDLLEELDDEDKRKE